MIQFFWLFGAAVALPILYAVFVSYFRMPLVADLARGEFDVTPENLPAVSVVVPARNEEEGIRGCLESLAALDYPKLEIIAINDRSTDQTGEIMEAIAREHSGKIRVLHVRELPAGWLGKTHAMSLGAAAAGGNWLLFTDGDVIFRADSLRRAIAYAEDRACDHLVLVPTMIMESRGERMMLAFWWMFLVAARPWKVPDRKSRAHIGAGAFNLIRHSAYDAIGGMAPLRMEIVEDLKLGQRVKQAGFHSRAVFGPDLVSLRWVRGAFGMINNLTKNFYAAFQFRWWLASGAILSVLTLHVAPFVLLWFAPGWSKLLFALALAGIFLLYVTGSKLSRISPLYFFLHPIAALLLSYAMLRSMLITSLQGGVEWRGTKYSLDELRAASAGERKDYSLVSSTPPPPIQ